MKTLQELSDLTKQRVIGANNHDENCYHLLIASSGFYWLSYYVDGQKMGITLKGTKKGNPFTRKPRFINNCELN